MEAHALRRGIDLAYITGPFFLGFAFECFGMGIVLILSINYFFSISSRPPLPSESSRKLGVTLVAVSLLLNSAQTVVDLFRGWSMFGSHFLDIAGFLRATPLFFVSPFLGLIPSTLTQLFLLRRITLFISSLDILWPRLAHPLVKHSFAGVVGVAILMAFVTGTISSLLVSRSGSLYTLSYQGSTTLFSINEMVWLATSTAVDLLLALVLCFELWWARRKLSMEGGLMKEIVTRLILVTFHGGMAVSGLQLASLLMYNYWSTNAFCYFPITFLPKVYNITLILSLSFPHSSQVMQIQNPSHMFSLPTIIDRQSRPHLPASPIYSHGGAGGSVGGGGSRAEGATPAGWSRSASSLVLDVQLPSSSHPYTQTQAQRRRSQADRQKSRSDGHLSDGEKPLSFSASGRDEERPREEKGSGDGGWLGWHPARMSVGDRDREREKERERERMKEREREWSAARYEVRINRFPVEINERRPFVQSDTRRPSEPDSIAPLLPRPHTYACAAPSTASTDRRPSLPFNSPLSASSPFTPGIRGSGSTSTPTLPLHMQMPSPPPTSMTVQRQHSFSSSLSLGGQGGGGGGGGGGSSGSRARTWLGSEGEGRESRQEAMGRFAQAQTMPSSFGNWSPWGGERDTGDAGGAGGAGERGDGGVDLMNPFGLSRRASANVSSTAPTAWTGAYPQPREGVLPTNPFHRRSLRSQSNAQSQSQSRPQSRPPSIDTSLPSDSRHPSLDPSISPLIDPSAAGMGGMGGVGGVGLERSRTLSSTFQDGGKGRRVFWI